MKLQIADCRMQIGAAVAALVLLVGGVASPVAQGSEERRKGYDEVLDADVRDGLVYYRTLKASRGRLDSFVSSLAEVSIDSAPRNEQVAFWLNAYNAIVLQTVINHYPMAQQTREYPARSIRQIPGAFERTTHRVAGKSVTLDQIEQTILPTFRDPRVFLALGRGAMGSGRLRSEAYTAARLETQLAEAASECVARAQCAEIDRAAGKVKVSAIFSWREKDFVDAFAAKAAPAFASRSPIERAVLAFLEPRLLATEREFLQKNTFLVEFTHFDWSLNDLTGR